MSGDQVAAYNERFTGRPAVEILAFFLETYRGKIAFATSLGAEDQVLTHLIASTDPSVKIFTLDTGRLFQETYDILDVTEKKYGIKIRTVFPDAPEVERMVAEKGINLFYESVENRVRCCRVRKVEPLKRALEGMEAWISGLRREQSVTRKEMQLVEWDGAFGLLKINPLLEWTEPQVWDYIRTHHIPYNALHDRGFRSIGCLPCTRATEPGGDIRAGRWWWELPENKECGLNKGGQA